MKRKGFAQIPLMIGLLIMAVAVPIATKLVQQNQDTRNRAAGCAGEGVAPWSGYPCCSGLILVTVNGKTVCGTGTNSTPTPAYRNCTIKTCGSGVCNSKTESVASNLACPPSNCTSNSNCASPTAVPPTAVPTTSGPSCSSLGGRCLSYNSTGSLTCSGGTVRQSSDCGPFVVAGVTQQGGCCVLAPTATPVPASGPICKSQGGWCLSLNSTGSMSCNTGNQQVLDCPKVSGNLYNQNVTVQGCCLPAPTAIPSVGPICKSQGGWCLSLNSIGSMTCNTGNQQTLDCPKVSGNVSNQNVSVQGCCLPKAAVTVVPTVGACAANNTSCGNGTKPCCDSGYECKSTYGGYFCIPKPGVSGTPICVNGTTKCESEFNNTSYEYKCVSGSWVKDKRCDGACNTAKTACISIARCTLGETKCNSASSSFEKCVDVSGTPMWEGTYCPNGCNSVGCLATPVVTINPTVTTNPVVTARPTTTPGCDPTKYKGSYDSTTKVWLHFDDAYTAACICSGSTTGTTYHYVCASDFWACGDGSKVVQVCSPTPTSAICKIKVGPYTLNDFSIWRSEFIEGNLGSVSRNTWNADFDCDGKVTLNDFSMWRTNFINSLIHN